MTALNVTRDGGIVLSNAGANITPQLPGFAFTIGTNIGAEAIIEALDNVSEVTVISSPKLLVRDNQSAKLQIGDQVPIVTSTAQGFDSTSRIVNQVEYRDTGVTLIVTARDELTPVVESIDAVDLDDDGAMTIEDGILAIGQLAVSETADTTSLDEFLAAWRAATLLP